MIGRFLDRSQGRDAVLALAARINAQLSEGEPTEVAFRPIPLDPLITRWLDHHEHVRCSSLATIGRYRMAVGHLVDFIMTQRNSVRADHFSSDMAEDFVRYLRTTQVSPNGHANTKNHALVRLNARDAGVSIRPTVCEVALQRIQECQ